VTALVRATYRLQLHRGFPLRAARALLPYLARLGVSHVYASPILRSRRGSLHGYDVVDPTRVDPELGGERAFEALVRGLHGRGMGLVLDIVPNHMAASSENPAWDDVLTHGRASRFASWFDIDWDAGRGRVVLPILGAPLEELLRSGDLALAFDHGAFRVRYFEHSLPLDPATLPDVMAAGRPRGQRALEEVVANLAALPARDPEASSARHEARHLTHRLADLTAKSPAVRACIARAVRAHSRPHGGPLLDALLERQVYRLVRWQRAPREMNYRRFFQINDLVALRQEDPAVFAATHARVLEWVRAGSVDGLRVDHIDGLSEPRQYLTRLAAAAGTDCPIWVEKILAEGEALPGVWPVEGTTGYEFLAALEAALLDARGYAQLETWYRRRIRPGRRIDDFHAAAVWGKRLVLDYLLWTDVRRVARRVPRPPSLSLSELHEALTEVIVGLPVYRTYVGRDEAAATGADAIQIERALAEARHRGRASRRALDVVARLHRGGAAAREADRLASVRRFQQVSSAAAAKGVEDTAFYRWVPLASRNEVGSDPGTSLAGATQRLHDANRRRARRWPHAILSTDTHDTKRSADVRARLDVLSEVPDGWARRVARWRKFNRGHRRRGTPDANTEYLFYQSLVGIWPLPDPARPDALPNAKALTALRNRIVAHMQKAAREGKRHTSWRRPDPEFEGALAEFVRDVLPARQETPFLADVASLVARIARPALWMSLGRVLVHLTAPGVPDLYQGSEIWNFALVDPDNRRPVDFAHRIHLLASLTRQDRRDRPALVRELIVHAEDGRVKLYLIRAALAARRRQPQLFARGRYQAIVAAGPRATHVLAFARRLGGQTAITVAPRCVLGLDADPPLREAAWGRTVLRLPPDVRARRFECALSGAVLRPRDGRLPLAEVLADFPAALLIGRA
jgi:malto-oligosyltrehalose synthase